MASSTVTSNSSLLRSRSLRVPPPSNALKVPSTSTPLPVTGPSNTTLFLTNLRLLDFDLRRDWPGIDAATISGKDQKRRIQCVEWALYQLFALWDPEEARNKLQPFFPPLEPLQSLNLRAALLRCLDQAKKSGVLGRDTVLRKTMLDECKGDRLEEVLAAFSNAVLKKVLQEGRTEHAAIAQQLAMENFSYTGERTVLSTLVVAHRASLSQCLRQREESRAKYRDFEDLMHLNERRVARRYEQLKQAIEEGAGQQNISLREIKELQDRVYANWGGGSEWLQSILYGDSQQTGDGILLERFEKVWGHVEEGRIGDIESERRVGLLEQLNARVMDQESRLARWQDFRRTLSKGSQKVTKPEEVAASLDAKKIDLGFDHHQDLHVGRKTERIPPAPSASLEEYTRLVDNMKLELANVGKAQTSSMRKLRQSLPPESPRSSVTPSPISQTVSNAQPEEQEWASASDSDESSPEWPEQSTKSTSHTPPSEAHSAPALKTETMPPPKPAPRNQLNAQPEQQQSAPKPEAPHKTRLSSKTVLESPSSNISDHEKAKDVESDLELADQILNSVATSSPSPKKPRHTLSLAERTRLSMARSSHPVYSDLHSDSDTMEPPRLSLKPRPSMAPKVPSSETETGPHADLIERTRKSMAGFEAAQKKAQLERRRSLKNQKKKERESTYFPRVDEDEQEGVGDLSAIELLEREVGEGEVDYESVFKSRPKIKTSPAVSPTRNWGGEEGV